MSWLKRINPTPTLPAHSGPYKVGSTDVEIPTSELQSPSANAPPADLPTVAFRVFYPCKQESDQKGVKWLPGPQREYISAYARFMGANSALAGVFSLLPQLLYYISMPVHQDADILTPPTKSARWPVVMFSHGLGGSRNAYSSICGSLASHGMVVIAPDHRDGSAPLSIHRTPGQKQKTKRVEYRSIAHQPNTQVYEERDEQLQIRLWELGMIHQALLKIDEGSSVKNVAQEHSKKAGRDMLGMFSNLLNVHKPGEITYAGHSFGACTMVQFVKSVYYHTEKRVQGYKPLFTPSKDSNLVRQITPANPVVLLDLWTLPTESPDTEWLMSKPMPCFQSAAGGKNLIAILSEAFYDWSTNFKQTKLVIAKPPPSQSSHPNQPGAHIFYPTSSAHLSQSDFGVLFPWVTGKVFGAKDPKRLLRLNTRAILQVLRENEIEVANTSAQDLEIEETACADQTLAQDAMILCKTKDSVRGWMNLDTDAEGGQSLSGADRVELAISVGTPIDKSGSSNERAGPGGAMFEGEGLGQLVEQRGR